MELKEIVIKYPYKAILSECRRIYYIFHYSSDLCIGVHSSTTNTYEFDIAPCKATINCFDFFTYLKANRTC